jgi:hypothetical protein
MEERKFDAVCADVARHFKSPSEIVSSSEFTREQKIKLLTQWELDLRLLMNASDESMTGMQPGKTADFLTQVRDALHELDAAPSLEQTGPGKLGGAESHKSQRER